MLKDKASPGRPLARGERIIAGPSVRNRGEGKTDLETLGGFSSSLPKTCCPLILHGPVQMFTFGDRKGYPTVEGEAHGGVTSLQAL